MHRLPVVYVIVGYTVEMFKWCSLKGSVKYVIFSSSFRVTLADASGSGHSLAPARVTLG